MGQSRNLQSIHRLFGVVAILLLTTLYGAYRLNADPLWVDEVISMQRSGHARYIDSTSPVDVWNRTALISDQVPGYYILLGLWGNLVGTTPFAMRVMSLLSGVLSVAVTYQIGKTLKGHLAGIASALILASSAFYMLFLHEMRTYTLLVFLIALFIWCYWLITHNKARWWVQIGLILAATGMMYSYYLSITVIASICFYHLLFVTKNREWWRVVILMAIAALLFLPWFLNSFSVFDDAVRNDMRTIHTAPVISAIVNLATAFSNKNIVFMLFLMLPGLQLRKESSRFAWFIPVFTLTLMIILNEPFGVFVNLRYTLILWIPLAIVAGIGIEYLKQYRLLLALVFALILVNGFLSNFSDSLEAEYDLAIRYLPWDMLVDTLKPYEEDGDVLTFIASIEGNDWEGVHEERVMPHYFYYSAIEPMFIEDVRNLSDEAFLADATRATQQGNRIWLAYDPELRSWRTGLFEDRLLENDYNYCGNFVNNEELYLDLYAHPDAIPDSPLITFGENEETQAKLALIQAVPDTVDNRLDIVHAWILDDEFPRHTLSLAVHILDADGNLVTQADYGLPEATFDCVHTPVSLEGIAPGEYRVGVFAYFWEDGTRILHNIDNEALVQQDYVITGEFVIEEK